MTAFHRTFAKRFVQDDRGSMSIEFVLQFTIFFAIFMAAAELGHVNIRHAMLERAVDETVRDIRVGTGTAPSYDEIRASLCTALAVDEKCEDNIRLEMQQVAPRGFSAPETSLDCRNMADQASPANEFNYGSENELMLLRACLRYKPLFPTTGIASAFNTDSEGYTQLIAKSVFVQEPR